jgi:hypothetical protein
VPPLTNSIANVRVDDPGFRRLVIDFVLFWYAFGLVLSGDCLALVGRQGACRYHQRNMTNCSMHSNCSMIH